MKSLILAMLALSPTLAAAQSYLNAGIDNGQMVVMLSLDAENPFAQHLVDAIKKSPLVKEVNNVYVDPGTVFQGAGFTLSTPKGQPVSLRIEGQSGVGEALELSGNFVGVRTMNGGFRGLHEALLQSRSEFAFTKKNPGQISPDAGEVDILETNGFGGEYLTCGEYYQQKDTTRCSIRIRQR